VQKAQAFLQQRAAATQGAVGEEGTAREVDLATLMKAALGGSGEAASEAAVATDE
jgi:hypothetical protein